MVHLLITAIDCPQISARFVNGGNLAGGAESGGSECT